MITHKGNIEGEGIFIYAIFTFLAGQHAWLVVVKYLRTMKFKGAATRGAVFRALLSTMRATKNYKLAILCG